MRKRLEVAAPFEVSAIDDRRKAHHLGLIVRAGSSDQAIHALDGVFEFGAAAVDTRDASGNQEPLMEQFLTEAGGDRPFVRGHFQSSLVSRSIWAFAASTRSLLIISDAL